MLIATGLCVLAVGCGDDDDDDDTPAAAPPAATQTATPDTGGSQAGGGGAPGGTAAIERAVKAAEAEVSGSKAYEVDTDTVGGNAVLQVKVAAGGESTEVTTSADGRDVTDSRADRDDADDARDAADAKVTLVDAIDAALDQADGRTLESVELDRDNGTLAYNVSFQGQSDDDEREVVVDAASGDAAPATNDD